jgi:hypothetical protein
MPSIFAGHSMLCPYKRHSGHSPVVLAAMPQQKNA